MSEQMVDRPLRSVFVGNIPYEVTEEKLREIFSEVGEVLSLKLVFDRETGKPKGYGFCEYKDVQTAMSAMRNLNGFEINGRILRVDNAGAERQRMAEMGGGGGGGRDRDMGHHNGPRHNNEDLNMRDEGPPPPEKAPEMISRAVAALPPEQMFDLMKQMKLCIQNNPQEARTMLLQNPQLSYALLQALVVMKIIDPPTAISMLSKDNHVGLGSLLPEGQMHNMSMQGGFGQPPPATENPWIAAAAAAGSGVPLMPPNPPGPFAQTPQPVPPVSVSMPVGGDLDLRQLDPRIRPQGGGNQDFDLRGDPRGQGQSDRGFSMDPRNRDRDLRDRDMRMGDRDLRDPRTDARDRDLRDRDLRDPRMFGSGSGGGNSSMPPSTTAPSATPSPLDPRAARRAAAGGSSSSGGGSAGASGGADLVNKAAMNAFSGMGLGPAATDKEKASLIMQVLQLSDEQISVLPAEQRQSILALKEQIAKSTSQGR